MIEKGKVGTLTFFCGKMGAGKSTKAKELARELNSVLLSEDDWLEALYPGKIASLQDYSKYSARLKPQIKDLVQSILSTGTSVVMDFPANTIKQREWFKGIFSEIDAPHELIYIDVSDEDCLCHISKRRREQPQRNNTDTKEMFDQVTRFFAEPSIDEGFNTIKVGKSANS